MNVRDNNQLELWNKLNERNTKLHKRSNKN